MNEKGIKYYKCLLSTFPGTGFSPATRSKELHLVTAPLLYEQPCLCVWSSITLNSFSVGYCVVLFYSLPRAVQQTVSKTCTASRAYGFRPRDGNTHPLPPSCRDRLPNRLDSLARRRQLLQGASRALQLALPLRGLVRGARGHTCLHRLGGGE